MSKKGGRRVRVQVGDVEVSLRLSEEPQTTAGIVEEWLPFSHTEQRIVRLLLKKKAQSREEIARGLDESVDGRLRGILATLVARRVLMVTTDGYLLNAPESKRVVIGRLLDALEGESVKEEGAE